ncbi:hypothetical protein [Variovorax saccharolyticus]|uniref:hypothetical protein n=1 Tax=Variovorax saccharolyticus TaxID=3053516 RepID=UPI00257918E5|nr:hypothetical protein [Variovorax sp. J31P216]MDM0024060.1 hypothetical protein [Variovorax sp. J31P216]
MTFDELPVGAKFRFFRRGMVLTKTSKGAYTRPGADEKKVEPDIAVLPEDENASTPIRRDPPKVDDAALLAKALDDYEAKAGKTPELAAARQALRRLDALARMKAAR